MTETTETPQTFTDADPTDNMSPAELLAHVNKVASEESGTAADTGDAKPATPAEGTPADKPAETPGEAQDAPAAAEAPAVDTAAKERADRLAAVLAQSEAAKERRALRDAQLKHEAALAQAKAEIEQARKEAAELKARVDAYKADPLAQLEADGFPADKLAQRALQAGTPEYKAELELKALKEQLLSEVRAEREAAAKAMAEERAKVEQQQHAAHYERLRQEFVRQASDVATYPTLAKVAALRPAALVQHAEEILQQASQRTGQTYTNAEVLSYLEGLYAQNFGLANPKSGPAASATSTETATGTSAPGTIAAGKPRTLSNGMTEKSTVNAVPADEMSESEFRKWAASQVTRSR